MARVVGVAGPAGAGKTTLVNALAAALPQATPIYIDRYQRITEQPLRDIVRWAERGADFDALDIPRLADDLARLKAGPAKYVLFETHFGRAHRASGRHIDFLVWLDTPLDVALARNVMDELAPLLPLAESGSLREGIAGVQRNLARYLDDVRRLRVLQRERVAAGADLVLDGMAQLDVMVDEIVRRLS
jgi:uridine kinase